MAPGGPPAQCYRGEATGGRLQLVLGAGSANTTLKFGGSRDADLELSSLSLAGVLPVGERTLMRAGGGTLLDGLR